MKTNVLVILGVSFLLCGVVGFVGCDTPHNSAGPDAENAGKPYSLVDGIRVNGHESNEQHPPQRTWEAWYRGQRLLGPSPLGNFWTEEAATLKYEQVRNGAK
jgi:hypothetical protein